MQDVSSKLDKLDKLAPGVESGSTGPNDIDDRPNLGSGLRLGLQLPSFLSNLPAPRFLPWAVQECVCVCVLSFFV